MFQVFSFKQKMIFFTLGLITITVVVGGVGYTGLGKVEQSYSKVTDSSLINIVLINEMSVTAAEVERAVFEALLPHKPEEFKKNIQEKIQLYLSADKAYQDVPFVPGEDAYYQNVSKAWQDYIEEIEKVLYLVERNDDSTKIASLIAGEITHKKKVFRKEVDALVRFNHENSKVWTSDAKRSSSTAGQAMLWGFLLEQLWVFLLA